MTLNLLPLQRSALGPNVTKITLESFLAWKKRKRQEKIDKLEQDMERRKADFKAGKALVVCSRFLPNPSLFYLTLFKIQDPVFKSLCNMSKMNASISLRYLCALIDQWS